MNVTVYLTTNLSLTNLRTRFVITNNMKMKTPCKVLHTSVNKKYELSETSETISIPQTTPITQNKRKYNIKLQMNKINELSHRNKINWFAYLSRFLFKFF